MDSLGLSGEVRIKRAQDDSGMLLGPALVKFQEMAAIVRQQNLAFGYGESQHLWVRDGHIRFSGLPRGQDVMAQAAQFQHHLFGDILVGVEPRH